jgi:hypothetical protein
VTAVIVPKPLGQLFSDPTDQQQQQGSRQHVRDQPERPVHACFDEFDAEAVERHVDGEGQETEARRLVRVDVTVIDGDVGHRLIPDLEPRLVEDRGPLAQRLDEREMRRLAGRVGLAHEPLREHRGGECQEGGPARDEEGSPRRLHSALRL